MNDSTQDERVTNMEVALQKTIAFVRHKAALRDEAALQLLDELNVDVLLDPNLADWYTLAEDSEYQGDNISDILEEIDAEVGQVVHFHRQTTINDVYVVPLADGTWKGYESEQLATAAAEAACEA